MSDKNLEAAKLMVQETLKITMEKVGDCADEVLNYIQSIDDNDSPEYICLAMSYFSALTGSLIEMHDEVIKLAMPNAEPIEVLRTIFGPLIVSGSSCAFAEVMKGLDDGEEE